MTEHLDQHHTLLICSVGGSHEPITASLRYWLPDRVIFLPSGSTQHIVNTALQHLTEITGRPLSPGCYDVRVVDDPEDLTACVRKFRGLRSKVDHWKNRGAEYRIVVDFTGGTKALTAALALVSHRWPCEFSYVGGNKRTKEGVGTVESGSERVVCSANPWDVLGYQAVEEAVTVFNHGGCAAAALLLERATKYAVQPGVKRKLATLKSVTDAYAAWDRFDHKDAQKHFNNAHKNQNDLIAIFGNDNDSLLVALERHSKQVAELVAQEEPTRAWVEDLLRNAQRRAAEGRFDDAVARLYRATEALAQVRLREHHGIADTKSVPIEKVPDPLRAEFSAKPGNEVVMLGMHDAYRLLKALNDDLGNRFIEQCSVDGKEVSPFSARNRSILAHGFEPISRQDYDRLHECLCSLLEQSDEADQHKWLLPSPG